MKKIIKLLSISALLFSTNALATEVSDQEMQQNLAAQQQNQELTSQLNSVVSEPAVLTPAADPKAKVQISNVDTSKMQQQVSYVCLSPQDKNTMKIRMLNDNLALAYRNCNLTDSQKQNYENLGDFFNGNDDKLVKIYTKLYGAHSFSKEMTNFISDNSNKASIKFSYDHDAFCNKYANIIDVKGTGRINESLDIFEISQGDICPK